MGHENDGWAFGVFALPGVQEARGLDELLLELGMKVGIRLAQILAKKRERSGVELRGILVRDRRKPQALREVERGRLDVDQGDLRDLGRSGPLDRDPLRSEAGCSYHEDAEENGKGCGDGEKDSSHGASARGE
jgi:hypothetical protein